MCETGAHPPCLNCVSRNRLSAALDPSFSLSSFRSRYTAPPDECFDAVGSAGHIVMLAGYGTDADAGADYWLLRNSWSKFWGMGGYMRIAQDNTCGVINNATYPWIA